MRCYRMFASQPSLLSRAVKYAAIASSTIPIFFIFLLSGFSRYSFIQDSELSIVSTTKSDVDNKNGLTQSDIFVLLNSTLERR